MGFILESDVAEAVYASFFVFWLMFVYFVKNYDYWLQRGVPQVPALFPLGSLPDLVFGRVHLATVLDKAYTEFREQRFFGVIEVRSPCLIVNDPELIREILTEKFDYFCDRSIIEMSTTEHLNHNLVTMKGEEWRDMRMKLTPAYSACKMRMMFSLVKECSDHLRHVVQEKTAASNVVDVNNVGSRFTMDVIGSCAFGLDIDTLSDKNARFYKITKTIMRYDIPFLFKLYLVKSFPIFHKLSLFNMTKSETSEYITNLIRKNVADRETNQQVKRCDFLGMLIKVRQNESILDDEESAASKNCDSFTRKHYKSDGMTIEQMAAETYVCFAAGFETSSSVISFCLYELSRNSNIQDRVLQEIENVLGRHGGNISFQALEEMTYLDQVVNETMRHYPPFSFLNRVCTQSFKIPQSEVTIEEGIRLTIPVYSLHHDARYYPDPDVFDPERFTPENCQARNKYVFLPFGEGPRKCIGMRFGLMLVKTAVVTLVYNYTVSLAPETPTPLELDSKSCVLQPSQPLWLALTPRKHRTL